jgi:hypothetical protein
MPKNSKGSSGKREADTGSPSGDASASSGRQGQGLFDQDRQVRRTPGQGPLSKERPTFDDPREQFLDDLFTFMDWRNLDIAYNTETGQFFLTFDIPKPIDKSEPERLRYQEAIGKRTKLLTNYDLARKRLPLQKLPEISVRFGDIRIDELPFQRCQYIVEGEIYNKLFLLAGIAPDEARAASAEREGKIIHFKRSAIDYERAFKGRECPETPAAAFQEHILRYLFVYLEPYGNINDVDIDTPRSTAEAHQLTKNQLTQEIVRLSDPNLPLSTLEDRWERSMIFLGEILIRMNTLFAKPENAMVDLLRYPNSYIVMNKCCALLLDPPEPPDGFLGKSIYERVKHEADILQQPLQDSSHRIVYAKRLLLRTVRDAMRIISDDPDEAEFYETELAQLDEFTDPDSNTNFSHVKHNLQAVMEIISQMAHDNKQMVDSGATEIESFETMYDFFVRMAQTIDAERGVRLLFEESQETGSCYKNMKSFMVAYQSATSPESSEEEPSEQTSSGRGRSKSV